MEIFLTILALSFWILFPIGIFLSVGQLDKNSDQIVRLEQNQQDSLEENIEEQAPDFRPVPFDWHHPIHYFREWMQHE